MKEKSIVKLVNYAVSCSLIDAEDRVWAANLLLDAIGETAFDTELDWSIDGELDSALEELTDLAAANGILDGDIQYTVFRLGFPLEVFADTAYSYVIRVTAKIIVFVGRLLR